MNLLKSLALLVAMTILSPLSAQAQCSGQIGAGHVCGNPTSSQRTPTDSTMSAIFGITGGVVLNGDIILTHPLTPNPDADAGTNISLGKGAMASIAPIHSTQYITAIGFNACAHVTTADHVTCIGSWSLAAITDATGSSNTAVGLDTLRVLTSGTGNSAFGEHSLANIITGTSNTAYGVGSIYFAVGGDENTAVGINSMAGTGVFTGSRNTSIGAYSLNSISGTSNGNVGVGYQSLNALTSGALNTALGFRAGWLITSANYNVLIGVAGLTTLATGNDNILIGTQSFPADTPTSSTSNYINIGGAIKGSIASGLTFPEVITASLNTGSLQTAQIGTVIRAANVNGTATRLELDAYGAQAFFTTLCTGGTAAAPTTLTSGTQCGGYNMFGYDGTALAGPAVTFRTFANQNWAVGAHGAYGEIAVTADGSTTLTSSIRFEADGGVTVPSTVTGGSKGSGTINATALYVGGVAAHSGILGPALGGTGVANNASSTLTISGNFGLTFTIGAARNLTIPATGTAALLGTANVFTAQQTISGIANDALSILGGAGTNAGLSVGRTAVDAYFVAIGGNAQYNPATLTGDALVRATSRLLLDGSNGGVSAVVVASTNVVTFPVGIITTSLTAASGTPNSICQNSATKEMTVNAALTCTVSSLDFKHDFKPLGGSACETLRAMTPGSFFYNDNDNRQRLGFASEYMAAVDRRLADGWDENSKPRSIDQNAILAIAVKCSQEQMADNDNLRADVEQLKRRVSR